MESNSNIEEFAGRIEVQKDYSNVKMTKSMKTNHDNRRKDCLFNYQSP